MCSYFFLFFFFFLLSSSGKSRGNVSVYLKSKLTIKLLFPFLHVQALSNNNIMPPSPIFGTYHLFEDLYHQNNLLKLLVRLSVFYLSVICRPPLSIFCCRDLLNRVLVFSPLRVIESYWKKIFHISTTWQSGDILLLPSSVVRSCAVEPHVEESCYRGKQSRVATEV